MIRSIFHDDDSVYVNLYIASEVDWQDKKLRLHQETDSPRQQGTRLTVFTEQPSQVALRLRIPYWCRSAQVRVNGRLLPVSASASSYLALLGPWKNGDTVELTLPMDLHVAPMPDDESVQAVVYGPLVLAGKLGEAPRDRWYDAEYERKDQPKTAPAIVADPADPQSWVHAEKEPLIFRAIGQSQPIVLLPMAHILHEQYSVYWNGRSQPRRHDNPQACAITVCGSCASAVCSRRDQQGGSAATAHSDGGDDGRHYAGARLFHRARHCVGPTQSPACTGRLPGQRAHRLFQRWRPKLGSSIGGTSTVSRLRRCIAGL